MKTVSFSMPPELHQRLKRAAKRDQRSTSQFLCLILEKELGVEKKKAK